jgi:hypothetical protein
VYTAPQQQLRKEALTRCRHLKALYVAFSPVHSLFAVLKTAAADRGMFSASVMGIRNFSHATSFIHHVLLHRQGCSPEQAT